MLCDPSVFLSHLILTLSLKCKTRSRREKFASSYKIPCFASSKSPFEVQLGSQQTPHASHPETEEGRCLWHNQRRGARATCEPSTPRRDPRASELVRSSRRHAQSFLPNHCRSEHSRACLPGPLWNSSPEGLTRRARTRSCSRSSILATNSSGSGSPPSSRAAH